MTGPFGQAHQVEQLVDPALALRGLRSHEPQWHLDVLRRAQDLDQAEGLEDERDRLPANVDQGVLGQTRDLPAVEDHPSRGRPVETAEEVEERRLATPRATADDEQLPPGDPQVDAAQGMDGAAARGVVASDADGFDDRAVHRPPITLRHRGARGSSEGAGRSGQIPMWSSSSRRRTRRSRPSASTWARGSCSRPARSSTANSSWTTR